MIYSKHIPKILSFTLVVFLGGVLIANAYTPLAPLPIGSKENPTGYESIGSYLAGMMKFLIALGGVIAIVTAIIGGVQRIASGISPSQKADANKRIENALVGLALVLTSYLILNSVNPNLVKIDLNLPKTMGTSRMSESTGNCCLSKSEIINDQKIFTGCDAGAWVTKNTCGDGIFTSGNNLSCVSRPLYKPSTILGVKTGNVEAVTTYLCK